ncbi:SdpI family protein [Staphylococcus pseudintermedius]|uniref:SdpI family protein n=1 Tax=Staphylococcus pseudintermedius TaxID=283734 RepID=UPI000C1C6DD5|nr:SdpI family protein [Staphylococcus pseudintermedius]EGQ3389019.1 SdpI family protein [Staphylococcus pseudintermedius]EGQ3561270.1 SdpI family protein [Staphylococcus pseudintermedius]EGQ3563389.1 SdpI family protein [Staphylococcus pseudintermedius]EGQ4408744.1 SdpI family protein [Staphylococcus pseudintermedius]EHT3417686.1 SdpI family protein [Staphylococcus pseudintermedius]
MLLFLLSTLTMLVSYLAFYMQSKKIGDKPNLFIGYRTPVSMKSEENWEFSQSYFKNVLIKSHFFLIILSIFWTIYDIITFLQKYTFIVQAAVYFISIIFIIIYTELGVKKFEKAQKNKFK